MNALTKPETNALSTQYRPQANTLMLDVASMDSMMRVAELMANGRSTVPAHLQKNPADCMAVVMQAMQWGMSPFVVAQKTHVVSGHLGYEAQLVNAVVQNSGAIDGRFHYEFRGNSPAIECRVGAIIRGENEVTWGEWLNENKVTTKNSPLWKTNPKQQLGYLQVKNWARMYCPGAILGVYSPDEFEAPQPRNMGQAVEVQSTPNPGPDDALLQAAYKNAEQGVAIYQSFWKSIGADKRKLLEPNHAKLKDVAIVADKERTVNAQKPAIDAQTGEIKGNVPSKTFDELMAAICSADTEDDLYAAGKFISPEAYPDEHEILSRKFDERLTELQGKATS